MSAREGLLGHLDRYLEALAARDPSRLPLAPGVRATENGQDIGIGRGLWATVTRVPDHDYAHVADDGGEQIAWIGVIDEHERPSVAFVRLRVRDGLIAEVETIVRRPNERLYDPSTMREPRAVVFAEIPAPERSGAAQLIAAGNAYFDGLEQADGGVIPVADDCTRFENGMRTVRVADVSRISGASALVFPMGIREQVDSGYFSYIDAVRDRRVVAVDVARGLVLMIVVFDHSARRRSVEVRGIGEVELPPYHQVPNSVLIAELFKVRAGVIEHVEAVLEFVPYGMPTGWEAQQT